MYRIGNFGFVIPASLFLGVQGIVLSIIYLIIAAATISTTARRQKGTTDFGVSYMNTTISGMQDCNGNGALSLAIISILLSIVGSAIYVS
jgi:hypothetical protein